MSWRVVQGDCREVMAAMEPDSVDAVVCDPPYGLEFMGKEWDRLDGGNFSKPGLGDRPTEWPSIAGDKFGGYNPTCATCGGRARGKRMCSCAAPGRGTQRAAPGTQTAELCRRCDPEQRTAPAEEAVMGSTTLCLMLALLLAPAFLASCSSTSEAEACMRVCQENGGRMSSYDPAEHYCRCAYPSEKGCP